MADHSRGRASRKTACRRSSIPLSRPRKTQPLRSMASRSVDKSDTALSQAQATEALNQELRNRLAILEAAEAARQEKTQPQPDQKPAEALPTRAKPAVTDIGTKYADYESYVEDLADWKTEQRE